LCWISPLADNFGVLAERENDADDNTTFFVSLVVLDFYTLTFKKLQTIEYTGTTLSIRVNKLDPAEFVLQLQIGNEEFMRVCKVVGTSIVIGEPVQLPCPCAYFDGRFYALIYIENEYSLIHVCLILCDLFNVYIF
jgi:hypothetical protein